MMKSVLAAVATVMFAGSVMAGSVESDLEKAFAADGTATWLIYGPVDETKLDEALKLLEPVKNRLRVGVYPTVEGHAPSYFQDRIEAAGFKVCRAWGHGAIVELAPDDSNALQREQYIGTKGVSDSDTLFFDTGDPTAAATEWEMGGEAPAGSAKDDFLFASLISPNAKFTRITKDAAVGPVASFPHQGDEARKCFGL